MRGSDVLVFIPALNEAEAIGRTIDDVLEYLPESLVLVINGPSEDDTARIARNRGVVVLDAPKGKGLAVRTTLPRILNGYPFSEYAYKWYVMLDGDFTYPARHIPDVVSELEDGADVVIGYRAVRERGAMTTVNIVGNWGLSVLASMLYSVRVKDVCSGLWGFRRRTLAKFALSSDQFTLEADLFANTVWGKCRLAQIPIEYRARRVGSHAKLKVSVGFEIALFLVRRRFSRTHR